MTRSHIQTRIWLSIGIFNLGFLLTTVVSQVERRRAERDLASLADAVLPAAQHGRDAEATFQRVIKGYSDLFMIDDRSGLDRAASEGVQVLESLNSIASAGGVPGDRTARARQLAATVGQFLADARAIYGKAPPAGDAMTPEYQIRVQGLVIETVRLKSSYRV